MLSSLFPFALHAVDSEKSEITISCSDLDDPNSCTINPSNATLYSVIATLNEVNACSFNENETVAVCETNVGQDLVCSRESPESDAVSCQFGEQTLVNCSLISDTSAECSIFTPTQQSVQSALYNIAKTGPQREMARVLATICTRQGTPLQVADSLQRDCNSIIDLAFSDDSNDIAEAEKILTQITPDGASTSIDAARMSLRGQFLNIAARLNELRNNASRQTRLSLNVREYGQAFRKFNLVGESEKSESKIDFSHLGVFINGSFSQSDKDNSPNELGFSGDSTDITAGLDYRIKNNVFAGAAFGYSASTHELNDKRGEIDLNSYSLTLFGIYYPSDNVFVNITGNFAGNDYDQSRYINYYVTSTDTTVNQTASARYFGDQYSLNLSSGYSWVRKALLLEPGVQLQYTRTTIDGYNEKMSAPNDPGSGWALQFEGLESNSLLLRLGGQATYTLGQSWGVLIPHAQLNWVREFEDKAQKISGQFIGDPSHTQFHLPTNNPDNNYLEFGLGASAILPMGRTLFVLYKSLIGFDDYNYYSISAGIRMEFN